MKMSSNFMHFKIRIYGSGIFLGSGRAPCLSTNSRFVPHNGPFLPAPRNLMDSFFFRDDFFCLLRFPGITFPLWLRMKKELVPSSDAEGKRGGRPSEDFGAGGQKQLNDRFFSLSSSFPPHGWRNSSARAKEKNGKLSRAASRNSIPLFPACQIL